jgi:hypothetical protein
MTLTSQLEWQLKQIPFSSLTCDQYLELISKALIESGQSCDDKYKGADRKSTATGPRTT